MIKKRQLQSGFTLALPAVAGVLCLGLAMSRPASRGTRQPAPALPPAAVVYERPDGIYLIRSGETDGQRIAEGRYPRWSPDGRFVAFIKDNQIMRVRADGTRAESLAASTAPRAVNYHPDGSSILFAEGQTVKAVDIDTHKVRTVLTGYSFYELDASADGLRIAATVNGRGGLGYEVRVFDLDSGQSRRVGSGCSASLSPDGSRVTNLRGSHKELTIRDARTGQPTARITAPAGLKFDNQFWSNRPDWIVSESEGPTHDIYLHYVPTDGAIQITRTGDCGRGDAYLEPAP